MDEATARLMADKGIWLSTQPFLSDEDTPPLTGQSRTNLLQVFAGTDNGLHTCEKTQDQDRLRLGSAVLRAIAERQGTMLTHLARWYANADILTMATAGNAELLAMSGPRNPYPGKLGVVEEGAFADLLLVDVNPARGHRASSPIRTRIFMVIMKDGKVYKNTLPG